MKQSENILDHLKPNRVPEPSADFFTELAQKTTSINQPKAKNTVSIKRIVYFVSSVAAMLLMVLLIMKPFGKTKSVETTTISKQLAEIETPEIEQFYQNQHFVPDTTNKAITNNNDTLQKKETKPVTLNSISTEELNNYLKEMEIELSSEETSTELYNI